MTEANISLTRKQTRIIERALARLTGPKTFIDVRSIEDLEGVTLSHDLQLPDGRMLMLSDTGLEQFELLVSTVHEADPFNGLVDYADLWTASKRTFGAFVASRQMAETPQEWFEPIAARLAPEIRSRIFAVPFVGIELKEIDEWVIGSLKVVCPSIGRLDEAGVDHGWADVASLIQKYRTWELWLIGPSEGTHRVAEARFRTLATLTAGLLAAAFAVMLVNGATDLFISPNMSGHNADGLATWFSWSESGENFSLHQSGRRGQRFPLDENLRSQLAQASVFSTAMRIFESDKRTPLEEAVARGFHWFADAHQDPSRVMQLVKYWSCIEAFFSLDQKDITRSLSVGVAAVLVFGGFSFARFDEYKDLKKRVARLYALRSRAVHRASVNHVTDRDVVELSRYASQLLWNAVSFVERGFRTPDEIKRHGEGVDEQMERGRSAASSGGQA